MMHYYYPMYMSGWGIGGGILSIIFWILIIVVIVTLVRAARGGRRWDYYHSSERSEALEILKSRYAKGEITKEEFEAKKADILA